MTELQNSHQWQSKQARSCAFRGLPLVTLLPGFVLGLAATEVLWPDHLLWALVSFVTLVLLGLSGLTLAIKKTGSFTTPLVGAYLLGGPFLLVSVFAAPPALKEIWLRAVGDRAHGIAVDCRSERGQRQGTNHFIAYEFSLRDEEKIYVNEQQVHTESYESMAIGSGVEVRYLSSNPTLSLLAQDHLGRTTIALWLGLNFGSALFVASILLLDRLEDWLLHRQANPPNP